jgi:hypothetical protein
MTAGIDTRADVQRQHSHRVRRREASDVAPAHAVTDEVDSGEVPDGKNPATRVGPRCAGSICERPAGR